MVILRTTRFNIQKFQILHTNYVRVFYWSQNKLRLVSCAPLI